MDIFIIGGGPSINETNLDLIKDKFVLGTNSAFKLGTWVDICFFVDARFHKWNQEELDKWPNRIITTCEEFKNHSKIEYYKAFDKAGLCKHSDKIARPNKGKNVGSSSIDLAIKLGGKRIILIGFDMKMKNGRHNYHNDHNHTPRDDVYNNFFRHFNGIVEELPDFGAEVINATPDSALKVFPKKSLESIIEESD